MDPSECFETTLGAYNIQIRGLYYNGTILAGYIIDFYVMDDERFNYIGCDEIDRSVIHIERGYSLNDLPPILPYQLARFIHIPYIKYPNISLNEEVLTAIIYHQMDLAYFVRIVDGKL